MRKLRNTLVLLSALVAVLQLSAQVRTPDEDDILETTINQASGRYYPELMMRYVMGDTTLTYDDYYYLYYGYAYDANYRPLDNSTPEDRLLESLSGIGTDGVATRAQAQELLLSAKDVMLVDPFSPSNINVMTFAYGILGDTINERISADRFNKVIHTITSSGTGLKEGSPWHVLRFSHVNDLLASRGLEIASRTVRSTKVEYVQLKPNTDKIKGYFFNFERIYWKRPELTPEREKNNWMINGIPINKRR